MENLFKDFRYGARTLSKHPTFTLVAVITLALGIGATTTIFSVVNGALLQPLPYPDSERLVVVWGNFEKLNIQRLPAKAGEFEDYAKQSQVFDLVGAYSTHNLNLTGLGEAERIRGTRVSGDFLRMLGAQVEAGRGLAASDLSPGNDQVVLLNKALWQTKFGGDPTIINRTIFLDGNAFKVIGIISSGFQVPQAASPQAGSTDVWLPLTYPTEQAALRRGPYYLNVLARLAPGVSIAAAQAQMQLLGEHFQRDLRGYRGPNGEDGGWHISLIPLKEEIVGDSRKTLPILMLAAFLLLAASCANVGNLILMRSERRRRELMVRSALGASRWRLTRQLLVEAIMICTVATVMGLLLANWGTQILMSFGDSVLPRAQELHFDSRVFLFAVLVAILTSAGLGILPARQLSQLGLLRSLALTQTPRLKRINSLLIVSEVSLATILLVGSGLLIKSLANLQRSNPGVAVQHLTVAELDLSGSTYSEPDRVGKFFRDLNQGIEAQPGVDAVTFSTGKPLSGDVRNDPFAIENRPLDPNNLTTAGWQLVGPNYFKTLGIPLVAGRDILDSDGEPLAPAVAIINEAMAARYFPNQNPLGLRMTLGLPRPDNPWLTIVGVAKNTPHRALGSTPEPDCYLSKVVSPQSHRYLFIRSSLDTAILAASVRHELRQQDPNQPLASIQTMDHVIQETTLSRRFNTWVLAMFAVTALLLAASGIYSVVSYSSTARVHEIGIRMALGAQPLRIVNLVLRDGLLPIFLGALFGLAGAVAFSRLLTGFMFGTSSVDPLTYGVIALALIAVGLTACYVPVRRALKVDPLISLRSE